MAYARARERFEPGDRPGIGSTVGNRLESMRSRNASVVSIGADDDRGDLPIEPPGQPQDLRHAVAASQALSMPRSRDAPALRRGRRG